MTNLLRALRGFPARLWLRISEPRVLSVLAALSYASLGVGGVSALIHPPDSLSGQIGVQATAILAAMLAWSGVSGVPAALAGIQWLERNAALSALIGLALYTSITVTLHVQTPGNRLVQASCLVGLALLIVSRWVRIEREPYHPTVSRTGRRIATEVLTPDDR